MHNFEIYYTAAVVILMSIALIKEIAKPALIIFSALILLILGDVITVSEAFVGFSNHGMLTVGILFVVSSALQCSASFRKDKVISSVSPEEKILVNDHLFFTGLPETIFELQKIPGLFVIKDSEFDMKNLDSDKTNTYEAVVSNSSTLVGQTVRESKFRDRYNAVILAVHRSGTRVNKKIGDIIIKPNDTLFILAEKGFDKNWYHSVDFSLVSASVDIYSKPTWKGNVSLVLLIFMVLAAALKITSMLMAAAITAILMVSINIINPTKAKNSVDFDVLLIIASAFGIGKAMTNSGLADLIANGLINSLEGFGIIGIIAGIFFITSFYTELITNNAAAALIFPIALSTAQNLQIAPKPIMITIAIAASACFATPIGYQTNLMVYGPGGYKFKDFLKVGIPMNLLVGILVTCIVYFLFYM